MINRIRFTLLGAVVGVIGICFSQVAWAEPVFLEPGAVAEGTLKNPTSSSLLRDHLDESLIWVVPPATGWVESLGRMKNADLDEAFVQRTCEAIEDLQGHSRRLQGETHRLAQDLSNLVNRVEDAQDEADCIELETWQQVYRRRDVQNRFFAIQELVIEKKRLVQSLKEDWELECEGTQKDCHALDEQIMVAQAQLDELAAALEQIQVVLDEIDAKILSLKKEESDVWAGIDKLKEELLARQDAIVHKERELLAMYANYARQPGDRVRFAYRSGLQENLRELEQANPQFAFKAVEGVQVRLHANMIPELLVDDYFTRLPAVLGFEIEGRELTGGSLAFDRLPESFEGTMQLSMIGTCPARKNDGQETPAGAAGEALFGTVATYEFHARVGNAFTMTYDEAQLRGFLAVRLRGTGVSQASDLRLLAKELLRLNYFGFQFGDGSLLHLEVKALKEKLVVRVIEAMLVKYGFGRLHNVDVNWLEHFRGPPKTKGLSSTLVQGVKNVNGRYLDTQWRVRELGPSASEPLPVSRRTIGERLPVSASVTYLPKN